MGEMDDMQRILCPACKQDGVLQWKETVTIAKGRTYRYKKLYVYHQHPKEHPKKPKWCYLTGENLKTLGITQKESSLTQNLAQNYPESDTSKSSLFNQKSLENKSAPIAQWLEQRFRKP
jgi:hypothetical protein